MSEEAGAGIVAAQRERPHRGTIFVEDARVLAQTEFEGRQFILRVHAPQCAAHAVPGSFAHVAVDPAVPMRRPLSIMRASASEGWVEFLYKIMGPGLEHLGARRAGDVVNLLGPIGKGFVAHAQYPRPLLLGGGVGIPPMVFFSEHLLTREDTRFQPLVLMGSEIPFPFRARPSTILLPGMPDGVIASMPLLEEWCVASRLASAAGFAGCYEGYVTDLAREWLAKQDAATRAQIEIFACGPTPMLRAAARVAREFALPCQVSLEEFMACAVGGCAGCTVQVNTPEGPAMKRVCVDGPVFDAYSVFG